MYGISVTDNTGTERTIQRTGPGAADITVDGDTINCYGWADFQADTAMEMYFVVAPKGCFSRIAFTGPYKDYIEAYLRQPFVPLHPAFRTAATYTRAEAERAGLVDPEHESCGEQWLASEPEHTMSAEQENDLDRIINDTADRLDAKYRAGQKEHGGNGWEMGAVKLAIAANEEAIDQVTYTDWLIRCTGRVGEHISAALFALNHGADEIAASKLRGALALINGIEGRK